MPDTLGRQPHLNLPNLLQENLALGTWVSNLETGCLSWSANLYQILGQNPGDFELSLENFLACVHCEDRARVQADIENSLAQKIPLNHQYRILKPTGEVRWLQTFADLVFSEQGEIRQLQGVCQDITSLIQSQEAHQKVQERCQRLFQATQDLIFVHSLPADSETRYCFEQVNPAACEQLGFSEAELLQMDPRDLVIEEQVHEIATEVKALADGEDLVFVKWLKTRNGGKKLYEMHSHTFYEADAPKVMTLARSLDSRQIRESEQALTRKRLQALIELNQISFANEQELIEAALEKALELTESEIGYFHFVNPDQENLTLGGWSRRVHEKCTSFHNNHYPLSRAGVWADCIRSKQPAVHNDYAALAEKKGLPEGHFPLVRHMSLPVLEGKEVVVILGVGNKATDYTETDIHQLQLLTEHIWQMLKRQRSEHKVREQEAIYASLIQSMGEGVMMVAQEGQLLAHNAKALQILGLKPAQIERFNYREPAHFARLKPMQINGEPFDFSEFPSEVTFRTGLPLTNLSLGFQRPDGEVRWLKLHSEPVWKNGQVQPDAVVVTFQDISEMRQTEQVLAEQKELLLERIQELRCLQQVSELASHYWEQLDDFYQQVVLSIPAAFVNPEQTHACLEIEGQTYLSANFSILAHSVLNLPIQMNGKLLGNLEICVDFEAVSSLLPEKEALMHNIVSILTRTYERVQSRQALREFNNNLEQEVNARTFELTQAIRALNGRVRELHILNQVALLLQVERPLEEIQVQLQAIFSQNSLFSDLKFQLELVLGETEHAQTGKHLCLPILVDERPVASLCFQSTQEIGLELPEHQRRLLETLCHLLEQYLHRQAMQASLIRAREVAEQANRAKSAFLANMSHEIRTPMNAILGFSQLLLDQNTDPRQQQYLETILHSGEALMRLINDILDLSKIETGKLELHLVPVNLLSLLQDIQALLEPSFERKGLFFELELLSDFPNCLLLDIVRLQQILLYLLGNALKFTAQGGVWLKASYQERTALSGKLSLQVVDTGVGISPEKQKLIFEAFKQVSEDAQGGAGLGLTIARRLAELMHAQLSVKSGIGIGSVFCLEFENIECFCAPEGSFEETQQDDLRFVSASLLIVDDVEGDLLLIQSMLEPYPFTFYSASDGQEACLLAEQVQPDLILMDIKMPVMGGEEALHVLRAQEKTRQIPIVALTALCLEQNEESLLQVGFDACLCKPLEKDSLLKVLAQFLKQRTHDLPINSPNEDTFTLEPAQKTTLKAIFLDTILPAWEALTDSFILNDLEAFLENCRLELAPYPLPELKSCLDSAEHQLSILDIESAQTSLTAFKQALSQLLLG
ncbi:hypothetical protein COW36_03220 [bacterium (Candidatus Blackallbacteria) CG17_big_fil_post_rev_8_21_14_2_50_48_46]|uniref:histidine kinase n=1 Tax=bacterium (Candidatus Blackallbacteria) CG17_big_fil_post_rev_8_21_14_2_50_48_46 TaxID=2014261 RepID=A0A2M7G9R1_9BACT|nr:MAG: hypothetical protein COW64_08725 [bacterium (Candidatus Blackallbacteria) CG18_big_fil_WC_8_21_14_2_50_49_26]PIW18867.1 MAG: hypothetical protein COW36_03220 [bacterium (Candidatus Blackallbacteria) CG17_big_fil_post_rev_8_21_14_2_50_48_46]PIW44858.1 MAG: hypothetical protein COW20_22615 [bacterium (Candidatus Blackallbacteria) CG13_big_fil_rev_8_21_14_2_50_49_14]